MRSYPDWAKDLTRREIDVLNGVLMGKSNKQICEDLGLSVKTVANYMSNAFAKLNVANRTQAAILMIKQAEESAA
jgi:DNA-binding NarL/FixJ family response regulator